MSPAANEADEELLAAIQKMGRLMSSRKATGRIADAAGTEIGQQGVQIVRALHRNGDLPIARLALAAGMDISAVSRQLRAFEADGLVERSPSADDARVAIISLTPAGTKVAERLRAVGLRHLTDTLRGWSADDRADLTRLLTRLVDDFAHTEVAGE
ncbi:MAG: MarR family transcriptional regulator [Actinobacteria bacterium]|nr:MarR family transcriptional regulator [Actinomycetota bacterium]